MEDVKRIRLDEGRRLVKWIAKHPKDWQNIANAFEQPLNADDCLHVIRIMEREEFYSLIAVIVSVNMQKRYMGNAMNQLMTEYMVEKIEGSGVLSFIDDMKKAIGIERLMQGVE